MPADDSELAVAWAPAAAGKGLRRLRSDALTLSLLLVRLANLGQGILIAAALVMFLTPVEQGAWYALLAVVSIAGYSELGIGQVIVQIVAHETGKGPEGHAKRGAYFRLALRFSIISAGLYALLLLAAGVIVFWKQIRGGRWELVTLLLSIAVTGGATFVISPLNCFFEGCQRVVIVNQRRFAQIAVYAIGCTAGLAAGLGAWAIVLGQGVAACTVGSMLFHQHREELRRYWRMPAAGVTWKHDFWPLQRRYALSWLSGILYTVALTPLLYRSSSAVEAGRFGLSWSLLSAASSISMVWLMSRSALFAGLVGGGRHAEFNRGYRRNFVKTGASYCLLGGGLAVGVTAIMHYRPAATSRLVAGGPFLILVLAAGLVMLNQAAAIYLRSFREEPLVKEVWLSSLLILGASLLLAPAHGALGVGLAVVAAQLVVLPLIWRKMRIYNRRQLAS